MRDDIQTMPRASLPTGSRTGRFALWSALLLVVLAIGSYNLHRATNLGMGLSPDSLHYIQVARSFAANHGFVHDEVTLEGVRSEYVTHYPPGYPAVVALLQVSGFSESTALWLLNLAAFLASSLLIAVMIHAASGSFFWAFWGAAAFTLHPNLLEVHAYAWSEAIFLTLMLGASLLLAKFLRGTLTIRQGIVAGLLYGLATTVRFAGLFLLPGALVAILAIYRIPLRQRTRFGAAFLLTSFLPAILVLLANLWFANAPSQRKIAFHPAGVRQLRDLASTTAGWIVPQDSFVWVKLLAVGILSLVLLWLTVRFLKDRRTNSTVLLLTAQILTYLVGLYLSVSLFDFQTQFDFRILSPVLALGIPWVACIGAACLVPQPLAKLAYIGAIALLGLFAWRAEGLVAQHSTPGWGYEGPAWQESEVVRFSRSLPVEAMILSNAAEAITFLSERPAIPLPWTYDPYSMQSNPAADRELNRVCERFLPPTDALLLITDKANPRYLIPSGTIVETCELREIYRAGDLVVYARTGRVPVALTEPPRRP